MARQTSNTASRSVRVNLDTWDKAKRRATHEGHNLNHVLTTFVDAYAGGQLDMPTVVTKFQQPREAKV